jgi:hypothetical protein
MAIKQSTHGFDSLAYLGSPFTPAAVYIQERNPTPKDNQGIPLGTIWINLLTRGVFILVEKLYDQTIKKTQGTWIDLVGINSVVTDAGSAVPINGILNILGGLNINTSGAGNTVTIHLDDTVHITGSMTADLGFTATIGDVTILAGNLNLPDTNQLESEGEITFGTNRFISNYGDNLFVGRNSGNTTLTPVTADNNIGIGKLALNSLTVGFDNVMLGDQAGQLIDSGEDNTGFGLKTLFILSSGNRNTALGSQAASQIDTGSDNIAIGYIAGQNWTTNDSNNISIGNTGVGGDNGIIRLGDDAIHVDTFIAGSANVARDLKLPATNGDGTEGYIYIGGSRFFSGYGIQNVFVGEASGSFLPLIDLAQGNVGVGALTLSAIVNGSGNVAVGVTSGASISDAIDNVCVGHNSGTAMTTAIDNTFVGHNSGVSLVTGNLNTLIGSYAGTVLNGNVGAIGNTALGSSALPNLVSGSANLALGGFAGQAFTTNESSNVVIQSNGVVGRSHEIRIGTTGGGDGQQNKCWIAAIRGVTTDVADAIPVLIDSTGQLGTVSSSERYKDDIEDMGPESDMIMALRPVTFTYKSDSTKRMQYGLIAEEVADLFPKLVVYDEDGLPDTVRYHELPILLLNELQKYAMVIENLKERIAVLERSIQ